MKERKFSPPFLIQMSSGDSNCHCDKFPHGSIHEVKQCEDGQLWKLVGVDPIPTQFKTKVIDEKPETKECPSCKKEFPKNWPFSKYGIENPGQPITEFAETCVRCYERKFITHQPRYSRDDYRQTIREEIKKELGIV